jgi:hypothetical protein
MYSNSGLGLLGSLILLIGIVLLVEEERKVSCNLSRRFQSAGLAVKVMSAKHPLMLRDLGAKF